MQYMGPDLIQSRQAATIIVFFSLLLKWNMCKSTARENRWKSEYLAWIQILAASIQVNARRTFPKSWCQGGK